jgi:hypothetical protein
VLKHLDEPAWIIGIALVLLFAFFFIVLGA